VRLLEMRRAALLPLFQSWGDYLMAWLDRRPADMHVAISALGQFKIQDDPEAIFLEGWLLCDAGELETGTRPPASRSRQGLLCGRNSFNQPGLRPAAEPSRFPGAFVGSGSGPPARIWAAFREGPAENSSSAVMHQRDGALNRDERVERAT